MLVQFNKGVSVKNEDHPCRTSMIPMNTTRLSTPGNMMLVQQNVIDLMQVQPQSGQLYHLAGPGHSGRSMRVIAEHWVAWVLMQGEAVHWIDGACRIDPSRLIPLLESLNADVEACLARLYLSRGFTLHQLDGQLSRLSDELKITRAPMLVVDGLLTMHQDDAIRRLESRSMLRRHLNLLERIVKIHNTAVMVITEAQSTCPHQERRIRSIYRRAQNRLRGTWRGGKRSRTLHLHHPQTGTQGRWLPTHQPQTRFQIKPRSFNERKMNPVMDACSLREKQR